MELTEIQIENFRSIKSQKIIMDRNCSILIGKNEAGKSNILKAIAAVFGKYKVSNKDKRKKISNETINGYYIRAKIIISNSDFDDIYNKFSKQYSNIESISFTNKISFFEFIKKVFYEIFVTINIADNEETFLSHWIFSDPDFNLVNELYLNGNLFNNDSQGNKIELIDIMKILFDIIKRQYNRNPYVCHFWENKNTFLLPNNIKINDFIASPSKFNSLYSIFILCNRQDIKKEFEDALSQDGDYENLLEQISREITSTFHSIWKDFKETSIEFKTNGTEIIIKVVNKAKYSFEDRSDGFKKFISILLMLSTQARSKKLGERDIILIDEPDQSLYPTSAKYLKDELLKISENSKVIYTTHSQYMIDSNCIERHLIIEKKDDITTINKQDQYSPYSNDELLRRVIGTSIFEVIKQKNIIFEGWLDKELFIKYCNFNKKTNDFNQVGIVYLGGISGVDTLVQLLILANKQFIIIADSDSTSRNKQKEFVKTYEEYASSWLSYGDIEQNIMTMEDFISSEFISKIIKRESPNYNYNMSKNAIENIDEAINNEKDRKQKIKNKIITELDKKDINDNYSSFVKQLQKKIEEL